MGSKLGDIPDEMRSFNDASPTSWNLFCAGGSQIVDCLSLGFTAHSTSDANIFPRIFNKIFSLVNEQKFDQARQVQHLAAAFSKMMPRNGNGEYSAEEKYILHRRGIINTDSVNPTYQTLTEDQNF